MYQNPALGQYHIEMELTMDFLLSLVHLSEGDMEIRPSSSYVWFYSKSG